jgi:hypothetical protein
MQPVTSTGYQPDFDLDNRRGQVGEQLVGTFLAALAQGTIEVKTDYGTLRTGNHYVETHQLGSDGLWRPSGLNVTQADWWCVAGPAGVGFVAIHVAQLKELAAAARRADQPLRGSGSNPTRGRLVRLAAITGAVFGA